MVLRPNFVGSRVSRMKGNDIYQTVGDVEKFLNLWSVALARVATDRRQGDTSPIP